MTPSLQKRLSAILGLALAVSGVTSYLILKTVIAPAFNTLEADVAETDLNRAALGINGQLQQMRAIVGDWAPWDQVNDYALGNDPDFVYTNIDQSTLQNLDVDLMQLHDRNGQKLWVGFIDQGEFAEIEALGRLGDADPAIEPLISHADPSSVVAGMLLTGRGPMILVSMPLVGEAGQGPINGTIMMGRILTEERLQILRDHIKVYFGIVPMSDVSSTLPAVVRQFESAPPDSIVQTVQDTSIYSYRMLTAIGGAPLGVLQARTGRQVSTLGQNAADLALLLFVVTSLLLIGGLWLLLRMDMVRPLGRLGEHMAGIRRSGELSARLTPHRNDEIGRLAVEFNELTGELQKARRQLVDQSFKAGRADTAAEVLHNIRNAMTPVVNVAENLAGALDELAGLRFRQAADGLADVHCADERRRDLLRYITAAADRLKEIASRAVDDVDLICQQTSLVEQILASQEEVTRLAPLSEQLDLADIVSEAISMLPPPASQEIELRVAPALSGMSVAGNRVQLSQVVGNVLLNAREAIQRGGRASGRIDVFAAGKNIGDVRMVQLSVRDSGAGLDGDTLARMFQRGFTTKDGGAGRPGLHWCANVVAMSGGSMRAESPGPGKGTTIHIVLPASGAQGVGNSTENDRNEPAGQA